MSFGLTDDELRVIIIAGQRREAERYMRSHNLSWHQVAHQFPARGIHYDKIILVGTWWKLTGVAELVNRAYDAVWPRRSLSGTKTQHVGGFRP